MRDFRQKEKTRSCLKTNRAVTSLACPGVISRLWLDRLPMVVQLSRFKEKKQQKNTYNITTAKKYALYYWWTVLKPPCYLDRLIQPWTRYYTGAGRARHDPVCFEATSFFFFLAEVPHYIVSIFTKICPQIVRSSPMRRSSLSLLYRSNIFHLKPLKLN